MHLGILSDTHNNVTYTKEALEAIGHIDYLIHAGDIGQNVLDYLTMLPIKTIAVFGNTDRGRISTSSPNIILQNPPYYFQIGSTTFKLMHEPYYLTPDSDVVIFGHTHMFECKREKALYLNPGEVCAREKPLIEAAILNLPDLKVRRVYKNIDQNIWMNEECA